MPCSATSSPAVSTCGSTRIPHRRLSAQRDPNETVNVKAATATRPSAWTPSWYGEPPGRKRPPDTGEAMHRDGADRVVDTESLDERHRNDRDRRGDEADHD